MENLVIARFHVSDFVAVINQSLDVAFGAIEIEGEVSEFKINQQKYIFFNLKDKESTVGCFMMRYQLRVQIEDGMKIVARVVPKLTNGGKFSLTVQALWPIGEGSLKRSFELLRQKLDKEGLFDESRKRLLPKMPTHVAIISSTQAAGYADFMKIAGERWGGITFDVFNVPVQGKDAADNIQKALTNIEQMQNLPEVIVIIRGGGSRDDLNAFNDEQLVRAIASSRVPVITGIGHETDESLADLAADLSASTPSNAAQMLLPDKREVRQLIQARIHGAMELLNRMLDEKIAIVKRHQSDVLGIWAHHIDNSEKILQSYKQLAAAYNPEKVLRQGYALLEGDKKVDGLLKITTKDEIMEAKVLAYEKRTND